MAIKKQSGGVEDLNFGMGTRTQLRKGQEVVITDINGEHIPYSETQSTTQKIAEVEVKAEAPTNSINNHKEDKDNPHEVTSEQVGAEPELGNPSVDGYILSSTISGFRSWIPGPSGGSGSVTWGAITGILSQQTDLQGELNLKLNVADPTFTGTLEGPTVSSPSHVVGDYTMQDGGLGAFNIRNTVFGSNKLHIWGADVPTLTLEETNLTWGGKPVAIAEDVLPVTNPTFLGTMTGPLYVTGTYAFRDHGLGAGSIYMVGGTDYVSWGDNSLELSLGTENLLWASNQVMVSDITQDTGAKVIENMVEITQADYDAITPVANTVYFIVG